MSRARTAKGNVVKQEAATMDVKVFHTLADVEQVFFPVQEEPLPGIE